MVSSRIRNTLLPALLVFMTAAAGDCSMTGPKTTNDDSTSQTQTWAFVINDGRTPPQTARVIIHGCVQSQCTGGAMTGTTPTWALMFGNCRLPMNISGNMSGNLVSFTVNGTGCGQSAVQGRATGNANGTFGRATSASGSITWNGYTDIFGSQQNFSGSAQWTARKVCDGECNV